MGRKCGDTTAINNLLIPFGCVGEFLLPEKRCFTRVSLRKSSSADSPQGEGMWYPPKERTEQLDAKLASLEMQPADCEEDGEDFLVRISACIRHLAVNELVPSSYLRDWIWIGSQFRINSGTDNRIHILTRRALLFLFECLDSRADKNTGFREDINWVTDSTVSELAGELGPNA